MSITWNGISSDTIGVIVERIPNRYVPTRRFSPQQVAGRNGNILLVDKAFPNVEQEYEVYLSAEAQGLPTVARACAEWLMAPTGYATLSDSYEPNITRQAFVMGGFDLENILNKFGRCTITFSCKPQKYLLTGDTPIEIPDGTTTTYTGDVVQFDVITGASITSLSATITPTQSGSGDPSPSNVRPITGLTGLSVYVSPTQDQQDATTYAIDWTSEAGTVYGGTLDVVTGELVVNKASVNLNPSWYWFVGNTQPSGMTVVSTTGFPSHVVGGEICSHYKRSTTPYIVDLSLGEFITAATSAYFCFKDSSGGTADEFKEYLTAQATAGTPVQVVYELATPLTYQLTPQEVEALVGTNNVWSSSGDVSVTVTTLLGGIVTNPTPFEARPLLTVSGVGEITINGKSIQILESVSDFEIDCETMEAEDNSKIYCMDFPELSGGENKIVGYGSITALTVVPRWWTL